MFECVCECVECTCMVGSGKSQWYYIKPLRFPQFTWEIQEFLINECVLYNQDYLTRRRRNNTLLTLFINALPQSTYQPIGSSA